MSGVTEDKRINRMLRSYWESKCNGRPHPEEKDIDPSEIEDIWEDCFLVEVRKGQEQLFRFEFMGQSIIEAYGDDLTGHEIYARLIRPGSGDISERFNEVVEKKEPILQETAFINRQGMEIRYRSCIMPLGPDGTVTHILGGMRWKGF